MSKRIGKILCPIDLEEDSRELLELATDCAEENGAELILIFVALAKLPSSSGIAADEFEANVAREKRQLETLCPPRKSVKYRHVFVRGNPAPCIVEAADELQCDLIVIGTHGRTGIRRLLIGSVAEHVIRHANCPVLSFRPGDLRAA